MADGPHISSAQRAAPRTGGEAAATLAGSWLARGKGGRLTVYVPGNGGLLRWTEARVGGPEWTGPEFFPMAGLTHLAVAQGADTYVHFLGRRERRRSEGHVEVDIVHAIQYQTGRPVTEWRSLGNPHKDQAKASAFGVPAAAVDSRGTVFVFVRNGGGGLMLRREQSDGKWAAWQDLKGSRLADGPVPAATSAGTVEVVVPTQRGVQEWRQSEADGPLTAGQPMQMHSLPGSGTALETAPGRVTYYWTDAGMSGTVAYRPGAWPVALGGAPGDGAIAALRAPLDGFDCTVLAQRGAGGTLLIGVCATEGEHNGVWWSDTMAECVGDPALAVDAYGRVVVAVLGPDGAARIARQEQGPGLTLSPRWHHL
ncbi:hypothetical protein [Streptomyces sp. NPDC058441]|uniref:hypothetical protein n=1 Tax=Streptomyces sp. NPDC058441 TaxID=3346502 RepID=UPI0036603E9C